MSIFGSAITSTINTFVSVIDGIKFALNSIGSKIGDIFSTVGSIYSKITSIDIKFWDGILNIANDIKSLPTLIVTAFTNMLKFLIIPSENYLQDNFDGLLTKLSTKLSLQSYTDFFNAISSETGGRIPNFTINILGTSATIINFDYFYQFKNDTDRWVRGFLFALMVLFNSNMIYKLIRKDNFTNGGGQGGMSVSVDTNPQLGVPRIGGK